MPNSPQDVHKKVLGKKGEKLVADYLKKQGFKILKKNYRTPFGEADIIVVSFYCDSEAMHRLEQKVLLLHGKEREHLKLLVREAQQVYAHFENDPPHIRMVKLDNAP